MILEVLNDRLTVCKVDSFAGINTGSGLFFIGVTDEEISLVCRTEDTPANTTDRVDGWRGFRVTGVLDFSLTGILSGISGVLAKAKIGIFAVSTYNTDYILVKENDLAEALSALECAGYTITEQK